jgi:hypothetical protein
MRGYMIDNAIQKVREKLSTFTSTLREETEARKMGKRPTLHRTKWMKTDHPWKNEKEQTETNPIKRELSM